MTPRPLPDRSGDQPEAGASSPRIVSSESLLAGHRELIIRHGNDQYRLRLTNSNKLILVK